MDHYPYTTGEYLRRFAWRLAWGVFCRFSPSFASGWRRLWLRLFGASVHPTAAVRQGAHVFHPWLLSVGAHSCLSDGAVIYNLGRVSIGSHSLLSQDAYVCAGTHDHLDPTLPLLRQEVEIGSGVWICAGAFVGPGVRVGDNAVVGARAVVTSDVEPGTIVAGNPARRIGARRGAAAAGEVPASSASEAP